MGDKKKKIIMAAVAGILTVAGIAGATNAYAMGKKPEKAADANAGGEASCAGKTSCSGKQ